MMGLHERKAQSSAGALCRVAVVIAWLAAACTVFAQDHEPCRLSVKGTPEQIGGQVGRAHGATIRGFLPYFLSLAVVKTGRPPPALYERAQEIASYISEGDRREMKAMAEAAGVRYEDILFLNLWYHFVSDRLFCRQLAVWGEWAPGGELIHARNLDWPEPPGGPLCRNHLILNVEPEGGIAYVALTWPGLIGVLTGTNREGITLGYNELVGLRQDVRLAEPVFLTLRRVLMTCATIEEAVDLLRQAAPLGNGSILISDARRKKAVVVEVFDGHVAVREAEGEMIGNANHVTTDLRIEGIEAGSPTWPACAVARYLGPPLDTDKLQQVMSDDLVMLPINILSVIFVPAHNRMLLSCGRLRAAEGEFREYELFPQAAEAPERAGPAGTGRRPSSVSPHPDLKESDP